MEKSMTTSRMTDEQIERAVEIYRSKLRKHQNEFASDAVQRAFGQKSFGNGLLAVTRTHVEMFSTMIFRRVRVNRTRKQQELLDATGRAQYTDRGVVNEMPRDDNGDEEVEMGFFKLDLSASGGYISDDDLDKELALRGLERDTYGQIQVNIDDPSFADEHPNGMHWKDKNGKWCFAAFDRWNGERSVDVRRCGHDWSGGWWFGGRRKKALSPSGTGNS